MFIIVFFVKLGHFSVGNYEKLILNQKVGNKIKKAQLAVKQLENKKKQTASCLLVQAQVTVSMSGINQFMFLLKTLHRLVL